jgi:hypothetical protein
LTLAAYIFIGLSHFRISGERSNSVGIVTRLLTKRPDFDSRQEHRDTYLFATASSLVTNEKRGTLFPEEKRLGREADYSPPSSAEVKNAWRHTSTPPIRLHDVALN